MDAQLEDLIAFYPDSTQPGIQTIITGKREFAELAGTPTEPPPPAPGMFYKHQEFIGRLMVWLDRLLIIHQTGTGKSCAMARVTEYYKKLRDSGGHIKRAYILVKGPSLKREIKNQLLCVCTPGDYLTPLVVNATTEDARSGNITREIKKWYSIRTYTKFANKLGEPIYEEYETRTKKKKRRMVGIQPRMSDEEIIRRYSNCIFFVDEVHNLRIDPTTGEDANEVRFVYQQLWRLFHLIYRSKVILSSATPMINEVEEIGPIMNLILPTDQQFPDHFNYTRANLQEYEPYLRGRISYVRALDTGAVIEYVGEPIDATYNIPNPAGGTTTVNSQATVYTSRMEQYQGEDGEIMGQNVGYNIAANRAGGGDFYMPKRQASLFVFPDNTYGNEGFQKYTISMGITYEEDETEEGGKKKKIRQTDDYRPTPELEVFLRSNNNLHFLSCKMAEIVRICTETEGSCFIYSDFIDIGAVMQGLAFEYTDLKVPSAKEPGYEKFTEDSSIFEGEGALPPVCSRRRGQEKRKVRIEKKPRYALMTSRTPNRRIKSMMEAFNSYENRHGEYIKVMIGSPVARDGINLANVLQVHIASAGWNPSAIYQAISRAIRSTSHVDLLEEKKETEANRLFDQLTDEEKENFRARGLSDQEIKKDLVKEMTPTIDVKVYKHVAIPEDGDSIDLQMYQLSEQKEIEIKKVERILKQSAVDCQIHYQRNVRAGDVEGSSTCDYDVCRYPCVDPPPPELLDDSTYDVYYSGPIVDRAVNSLIEIFKQKFTLTTTEIYALLPDYKPKFIDIALERLVNNKIQLIDRYGYASYLRADGATLFLQRHYPIVTPSQQRDKYTLNAYTANLIANKMSTIADKLADLQIDEQTDLVDELKRINPNSPRFDQILDQFNIENKVQLLEEAIKSVVVDDLTSPYIEGIMNKFSNVWFAFHEPTQELGKAATALAARGTGRGRKPKAEGRVRIRKLNLVETGELQVETETPIVYVHTLYNQVTGNVAYAVTARFNKAEGRIRILKPGSPWRDTNQYELPVYNSLIQREMTNRLLPYEQFDIYGTILHDKKFRIRDKQGEDINVAAQDARMINKGKECKTWKKTELYDILMKLGVPPPEKAPPAITDRPGLINDLLVHKVGGNREELEKMPLEQLQFYYRWNRSGATRNLICDTLKDRLQEMGRLYVQ
jgi:hypothetical protein